MSRQRRPYEHGWYWYRHTDQHRWIVLEVWSDDGVWWCAPNKMRRDDNNLIENFDGEWHGPLKPPE